MKITIKPIYVLGLILSLLAGSYLIGRHKGYQRGENASKGLIQALNGKIKEYEVELSGAKQTAFQMTQMVVSARQALQNELIQKEELKKLYLKKADEVTRLQSEIKIYKDSIGHTGVVVEIKHDTIYPENAILLPFDFSCKDPYFNLRGRFNDKGIMSAEVSMWENLSVYSGIDKHTGLRSVVVTSDNPYVSINKILSFKIEEKPTPKWGLGVQAGYGLSADLKPVPYVGLGLTRTFIRF